VRRLSQLQEAAEFLGLQPAEASADLEMNLPLQANSLLQLFKHFSETTSRFQVKLMQLESSTGVERLMHVYSADFTAYAKNYIALFEKLISAPPIAEVRVSERIDPMDLLRDLESKNYLASPAIEYARLKKLGF